MRRRLFNICTALSLLLFVAVCVLWVRSFWVRNVVTRVRTNVHDEPPPARGVWYYSYVDTITAARGAVRFQQSREDINAGRTMAWPVAGWSHRTPMKLDNVSLLRHFAAPPRRNWIVGGFQLTAEDLAAERYRFGYRSITFPYWLRRRYREPL